MSFWRKALVTSALTLSCLTAAFSTKLSYAYFANAVAGSNSSANGTVMTGNWRDYHFEGTAITTAAQFNAMLNTNNSNTYHLLNNIDFGGASLTARNSTFSGTFYGNSFTISNLVVPKAHKAIFFATSGATIQNINLSNIDVGTSGNRATSPAGILVATNNGDNTNISKIRITGSTLYTSGNNGTGGVVGTSTKIITIANTSVTNTIINSTGNSSGGLLGLMSTTATISDVYVEATITAASYAGGLYGSLANGSSSNTISRAIVYSTITATTRYSAGIVGYNASNKVHAITDYLFTGQLNSPLNSAGTIYNSILMGQTNSWASQWTSTNIASYAKMTGTSASYATNYVALRTSLTTTWWESNISNISSSLLWTYNATSHLYNLRALA